MNSTRFRITVLLALALFVGVVGANAQDAPIAAGRAPIINPQSYPGQFWTDTGNVSPTEHNDIISASYLEQGITLFRTNNGFTFTPYASFGVTADTQGFDWNNRIQVNAGGRLNKYFKKGIVSVGDRLLVRRSLDWQREKGRHDRTGQLLVRLADAR